MSLADLKFPSRQGRVEGKWAPLMFEPIFGSGERFIVAVVAVLDGDVHIKSAPALERFTCLYGSASTDILLAIQITIDDLKLRAGKLGSAILDNSEVATRNACLGKHRLGNGQSVDEVLDGAL